MTSCIVELGFIQSDEDNRLYDENMDAYAKAIAESAIKEALRAKDEAK
jgi:N-acetylmuramoyl-L-alanine amidase